MYITMKKINPTCEAMMRKDVQMSIKMEPELHEQFMAAAANRHRPAAQIIRDLMRDFVNVQATAAEHDLWFQDQVSAGIAAANAGKLTANAEVESAFSARRAKSK
jgi:predicted transcriptional regulator